MSCELVQQDGDPVDVAAALEVRLDLLGRGAVVDIAHENAAGVDVLFVLAQVVCLLVQIRLHLAQLRSFCLHLLHAPLHRGDLFLVVPIVVAGI